MRCYYEVLGVENSSDADVIKKAYYRLSLKYHPDKNVGREVEVTPIYQEIMEAYKVLSDPHERAWYDKHRDRILQGGMGRSGSDYQEERLDVYKYFTPSCYQGFSNTEMGFYAVYGIVFKEIREEEMRATVDLKDFKADDFPDFGDADSDFQNVVNRFYSHWEVFNSRKSYAWVETYDSRNAPHRYARRAMEMENKKLRDAARRERNEEVRALVAFVKKRDPRVAAERQRLQEESEARRLQALRVAEQVRARNRAQLAEELAEWQEAQAKWNADESLATERELQRLEAHWGGDDGEVEEVEDEPKETVNSDENQSDEEMIDTEGLYCPACNKSFKTKAAYENHLPSKKHKKQVAILRDKLISEDPSMADNVDNLLNFSVTKEEAASDDSDPDGYYAKSKGKSKRAKKNQCQNKKAPNIDPPTENGDPITSPATDNNVEENTIGDTRDPIVDVDQSSIGKDVINSDGSWKCKVCESTFPTRNKLFAHIKETGHAALKSEAPPKSAKSKKIKNKKVK